MLLFSFFAHEKLLIWATRLEHFPSQRRVPPGPGRLLREPATGRGGKAAGLTGIDLFILCNKAFANPTL